MRDLSPFVAIACFALVAACGKTHPTASDPGADGSALAQDAGAGRCHDRQCLVPAGTFMMGSPPDEPYRGRYTEELHSVTFTHAILYDQYETTQAEWMAAGFPNLAGTKANSSGGVDCTESTCPAAMLTWFEAAQYANVRSKKEGYEECFELVGCTGTVGVDFNCAGVHATTPSYYDCTGYRLPTMPEFQYAARAGTRTAFYSGELGSYTDQCVAIEHLEAIAWYCSNSANHTHPVGQKVPNAFGLYDMLGNAFEFAGSRPDGDTRSLGPTTDPYPMFESNAEFGLAGGGFFGQPFTLRAANQALITRTTAPRSLNAGPGGGFRLVRSLTPSEAAAW